MRRCGDAALRRCGVTPSSGTTAGMHTPRAAGPATSAASAAPPPLRLNASQAHYTVEAAGITFRGDHEEIRVRMRKGMVVLLTLMAVEGSTRDRGALVRALVKEAIDARLIRATCDHTWPRGGGRCSQCGRLPADANGSAGVELVLRFQSVAEALAFKLDPQARAAALSRADWTQGALVPVSPG